MGDILVAGRRTLNLRHVKVREAVHTDSTDFTAIHGEFEGLEACFFCLGVSAAGRRGEEYTRITHDYPPAAARAMGENNPSLTFAYVSGEGTDGTEAGRSRWARVKGRTENALLAMPFHAHMFRPEYIRPPRGAVSRTAAYRRMYRLTSWFYPLLYRLAPGYTTTTGHLGRAMIAVVRLNGRGPCVLHSPDINRLGTATSTGAAPEG